MGLRTSSRFFEGLLLLCLLAHGVFVMSTGRMIQMDEVFFKAAGREWAATGRFAAPECAGFQHLQPPCEEIWFAQPPVYTFLFGLFVKLPFIGFGRWQCILFDELIHLLQAWLTFRLARRLDLRVPPGLCFVLALATLPLGKLARPDELAVCLGLIAFLPILRMPVRLWAIIVAGIFIGLSAGASTAAGAMLGIIAVNILWFRVEGIPRKIGASAVLGLASLVAFAAVLAPILIPHPEAYHQYMGHVRWQYAFHEREGVVEMMLFALRVGYCYFLFTFLLLAVGGLCAWFNRKQLVAMEWGLLWVGPIGAVILLAVNFPYKFTYLWFVGPWSLVAAGTNIYLLLPYIGEWRARVLVMPTLCAVVMGAVPMTRENAIYLALPREQRYEYNLARVRKFLTPGSVVVTNFFWWGLVNDYRVYDVGFGYPNPEDVDFIILTNDKWEPGGIQTVLPELRPDYVENHFTMLDDNRNSELLTIGNVQVPNSALGFGARVLAQMGPRKEELERK